MRDRMLPKNKNVSIGVNSQQGRVWGQKYTALERSVVATFRVDFGYISDIFCTLFIWLKLYLVNSIEVEHYNLLNTVRNSYEIIEEIEEKSLHGWKPAYAILKSSTFLRNPVVNLACRI